MRNTRSLDHQVVQLERRIRRLEMARPAAAGGGGALGPDLTAIEALVGDGYSQRISSGVWSLTPAASLIVANGGMLATDITDLVDAAIIDAAIYSDLADVTVLADAADYTDTALAGYTPLTPAITALLSLSNGMVVSSGGTFITRAIAPGSGITVTNGDGNAGNPTVALNGEVMQYTYVQLVNALGLFQ